MQTIARFSFAVAAVLMATATVTTATPVLATAGERGRGGTVDADALIVSSKSGDSAGARRYCLVRRDTGHRIGCHTQSQWARRGVTLRSR